MSGLGLYQPPTEINPERVVFDVDQMTRKAYRYFLKAGFPYCRLPPHVCMDVINKLAQAEGEPLRQSKLGLRVADTYHPHRFHATTDKNRSPYDAFHIKKLLKKAIRFQLQHGKKVHTEYFNSLSFVSGTQSCSNFRPGFACYLYRKYCKPGDTVLDTSTGYGGRLVGFMASGIAGLYIGIDPNTQTHTGNRKMADDLGFEDKVELHNLPAEDVEHSVVKGRCDFAFTSPPYFTKEHYSDEPTQSWKRYPTDSAWVDGFLRPMMSLQYAALKPGKFALVNIAAVKIGSKVYPADQWCQGVGKEVGFRFVKRESFALPRMVGKGSTGKVRTEPVLVFQKV